MKNFTPILFLIFLLGVLVLPVGASDHEQNSENSIIPCGQSNEEGVIEKPCETLHDFFKLINNVIRFIFLRLALPIAAIMFAYAGFLLVTSGGSEERRGQAKAIFTKVAIGLVLAAGAWLIVVTLLEIAGYQFTREFFNRPQ